MCTIGLLIKPELDRYSEKLSVAHGRIVNGRYDSAGMRKVDGDLFVPVRGSACGTTRNDAEPRRVQADNGRFSRRGGFRGEYRERAKAKNFRGLARLLERWKAAGTPLPPHPHRFARHPLFSPLSFYPLPIDLISRSDNTTIQFPRPLPDPSVLFRLAWYWRNTGPCKIPVMQVIGDAFSKLIPSLVCHRIVSIFLNIGTASDNQEKWNSINKKIVAFDKI